MVPGLLSVAIVYLDACVFQGLDSPVFRERVNALIQILRILGETWPLSKQVAEDIQAIADEYLAPIDYSSCQSSSSGSDKWNLAVDSAISTTPFLGSAAAAFDPLPDPNFVQGWLATYDWSDVLNSNGTGGCWRG
jgi:hypothetical protein